MRAGKSLLTVALVALPRGAWAVQEHTGEGLAAHQLGHAALLFAMASLARWGLRRPPGSAWRRIGAGALWFCAWNVGAMIRHALPPESPALLARVLAFDYTLLLPALALLWLGVARLARETRRV